MSAEQPNSSVAASPILLTATAEPAVQTTSHVQRGSGLRSVAAAVLAVVCLAGAGVLLAEPEPSPTAAPPAASNEGPTPAASAEGPVVPLVERVRPAAGLSSAPRIVDVPPVFGTDIIDAAIEPPPRRAARRTDQPPVAGLDIVDPVVAEQP